MVREILEKGLPRKITNQKMNEYLKEIGEKVGINEPIYRTQTKGGLTVETILPKFELITTHTARRSFATNLYLSGFAAVNIMLITGHKTENSFMKYIKVTKEENAKLLQLHWGEKPMMKVV